MKKNKSISTFVFVCLFLWLAFPMLTAEAEPTLEEKLATAQVAADTAWLLISSALVLLMTPGLAFFYGGFVAKRNVLNTLMMSFILMGIVGVTWILWGYPLAFDPGNPFIGSFKWMFLNGVGIETTDF